VTEKNSSKVSLKHSDAKWTVTAANDKWALNLNGPLVKDDWKVDGTAAYEAKPIKKEWKVNVSANVTSPEISGAKAFVNVSNKFVLEISNHTFLTLNR